MSFASLKPTELGEQYGGMEKIPHDVLYEYIQANRADLVNLAKMGVEQVTKAPLGMEVRRRCKRDLFWLIRYFCWETNPAGVGKPVSENRITEEEYLILCDFFIQKDDSKGIIEQDTFKNRLLLWPRGGFKSTCDILDAVQWILNFPHIRILFMSGAPDLAEGFLGELKGHFFIKEEPSLMNLFFPEFCVPEDRREAADMFICPVWAAKGVKRKEPTVHATSVGATKSGWHYEVEKFDDAVCDRNTSSAEVAVEVSNKLFLAERLLLPGGFYVDYIGTRYLDEDHYGIMLERNVGEMVTKSGPCWTYTENHSTSTKILIGRGMVMKPEVALQLEKEGRPITYAEAGETGCDLLLPKVMPYSWLMLEYRKNEIVFEGQINQNPRPATVTTFDLPMMKRATVSQVEMPFHGPISQVWDFAFSKKKKRDYCTGSSVLWNDKGTGFVHDLIRQRFKPDELAKKVVEFAAKWRPFVIGIENAAGSQLLEPTIIYHAKQTGNPEVIAVCSKIDWITVDNQVDAKRIRMGALHPLIVNNQLKFANYLPYLDVLYSEFEKCMTTHNHDDIPDVLSYQPRYMPRTADMATGGRFDEGSFGLTMEQAQYNLLFEPNCDAFGNPGMGVPQPLFQPESLEEGPARSTHPGLDPILGSGLLG